MLGLAALKVMERELLETPDDCMSMNAMSKFLLGINNTDDPINPHQVSMFACMSVLDITYIDPDSRNDGCWRVDQDRGDEFPFHYK